MDALTTEAIGDVQSHGDRQATAPSGTQKRPKLNCTPDQCLWSGKSRSGRHAHNQKFHPNIVGYSIGKTGIECSACSLTVSSVQLLAEHLACDHSENVRIEDREFDSHEEFKEWEREIRNLSCVDFVSRRQWKKSAKMQHESKMYYCSRSGAEERKGKGKRAPRVSVRAGQHCSAFMKVQRFFDGKVVVKYCLDHYGHEINVARLRLLSSEKALIAHYLKEEHSTDWVVKRLRELHPSPTQRLYYITAQAVENAKDEYGIESSRLHSQDMISVAERVQREVWKVENEPDYCSIFFNYSPATDDKGTSFKLGVMTQEQLEWLRLYGNNGLAVDGTHNSTRYKFVLVTLLVLDERQKGLPVAHWFCKSESEAEITPFFQEIKARVPDLCPRVLMADDAPAYHNAWSSVFGDLEGTKRIMCQWHIIKNWRKFLRSVEKDKVRQAKMHAHLRVLLRQPSKESFTKKLSEVLSWLSLEGRDDFRRYLEGHYLQPEKLKKWAPYMRRKQSFNVNMAIESFHGQFKGKYLRRSENRRMDFTVQALLKFVADVSRDADVMKQVPTCFRQFRLLANNRNHRNAVEFYSDHQDFLQRTPDPAIFIVKSATKQNSSYVVKRLQACPCDRLRRCRFDGCQLCWEEFDCDCLDSCRAGVGCKHAHAIKFFLLPSEYAPASSPADRSRASHISTELITVHNVETAESTEVPSLDEESSRQPNLVSITKRNIQILDSLIDGVPEQFQFDLNALVECAIKFANTHTTMVAPRQQNNGRPPNAQIQNVLKRTALANKQKKARQRMAAANEPLNVPDEDVTCCSACFRGEIGEEWIDCDICHLWYHKKCVGFPNSEYYECSLHSN